MDGIRNYYKKSFTIKEKKYYHTGMELVSLDSRASKQSQGTKSSGAVSGQGSVTSIKEPVTVSGTVTRKPVCL